MTTVEGVPVPDSDVVMVPVRELKTIHLDKGDALVIKGPDQITQAQAHAISEHLANLFPDNKILYCVGGIEVQVIADPTKKPRKRRPKPLKTGEKETRG